MTITEGPEELKDTVPAQLIAAIFQAMVAAEDTHVQFDWTTVPPGVSHTATSAMVQALVASPETLHHVRTSLGWALPDQESWKVATQDDPDLLRVINLEGGKNIKRETR